MYFEIYNGIGPDTTFLVTKECCACLSQAPNAV